jgi:hypothetical protein
MRAADVLLSYALAAREVCRRRNGPDRPCC